MRRGLPAIADDTGLEVDALGGRPGVRSARYAGENAHLCGQRREAVERARAGRRRRAGSQDGPIPHRGVGGSSRTADGWSQKASRRTISRRRGTEGFGYDPVFVRPTATDVRSPR